MSTYFPGKLNHPPDPNLKAAFEANPSEFYLLGRLLTIAYAVTSVPLVYKLGERVSGKRVGLIAAWLSVLSPLAVTHARMVRTDSAAVFYGLLGLWLCIKLYEKPGFGKQFAAGLVVGLAIATRYFMVVLTAVLLAVDGLLLWRPRFSKTNCGISFLHVAAGFIAVVLGFALSTPYFFLDFGTAMQNLKVEARSTHIGAEGLSPIGNLCFYLTQAIPGAITWPCAILAAVGFLLAFWKFQAKQILLIGFVGVFLGGISFSPLHWHRWIIQVIPVVVLFSAGALDQIAIAFAKSLKASTGAVLSGVLLLTSAWPLYRTVIVGIQGFNPSTRVLAREWILANVPSGSRIAQEWYTAPLAGTDYMLFEQFSLASGRTLEDYSRERYNYLVVSSAVYGRYLAER